MDTQQGVLHHRELLSEHSRHSQEQAGHGPIPLLGGGPTSEAASDGDGGEGADVTEPWPRTTSGGGGWVSSLWSLRQELPDMFAWPSTLS